MRATIDGIEIEGTPSEIAEFLATIRPTKEGSVESPKAHNSDGESAEIQGISEKFAYRALRRLPLSLAQTKLLRTLKDASPRWTLSSDLQAALKCSPTSLGGVFGGLGRRTSATKGYEFGFSLWEWQWDEDEGQFAYRLPQSVVAALDRVEP